MPVLGCVTTTLSVGFLNKLFGLQFGGKLISFSVDKEAEAQALQNVQPGQPAPYVSRTVQISQVVTEPEFVQKSAQLERALNSGDFVGMYFL